LDWDSIKQLDATFYSNTGTTNRYRQIHRLQMDGDRDQICWAYCGSRHINAILYPRSTRFVGHLTEVGVRQREWKFMSWQVISHKREFEVLDLARADTRDIYMVEN